MRMKLKSRRIKHTVKAVRRDIRRGRSALQRAAAVKPDFVENVRKYVLGTIPSEQYFITVDGRSLRSIYELVDALASMSDESFFHHVTEERNDFSTWITESLQEPALGDAVRKCSTRVETQIALLKFLTARIR
ncbi:hypothetical protein HYV81_06055 [Candidatus Woesearchaeota archaeon]|nr:hypothetical protein [Candidatus Woesearchaeota archaeon]